MKKIYRNLRKISFILLNESLNVLKISEKEKKEYEEKFKKSNWYNGELMCLKKIIKKENNSELHYGKSNFFDALILRLKNKKINPIIAVNAVIEVEDCIIMVRRSYDVPVYAGWWDFPAGMIHFRESIEERLFNRIENDTLIKKDKISIIGRIPNLVIWDEITFDFFYYIKYLEPKKELQSFLDRNFEKDKILLVSKSKIKDFLKNNKVVFPEVFDVLRNDKANISF